MAESVEHNRERGGTSAGANRHRERRTLRYRPQTANGSVLPRQLQRPYRMIVCDWDGTAVMSRQEDASPIRMLLEKLLRFGVTIVVTTGTNFSNIDRQLSAAIRGPHKQSLYLSTNRGSEVYGFTAQSDPVLLWRREATPEDERLLTEIAEDVRDRVLASTGLHVGIVYDRLNRRKIDLIPLPEWSDPPKSAVGELFQAVQARLEDAGLAGGLREVVAMTKRVARKKGLTNARVTSDVKHVEIGLTDKSDAIAWVLREVAQPRGIPLEDILIGGDEFGPLMGVQGSDAMMMAAQTRGAVFVSVGVEPGGVPPGVIHLGGGPRIFRTVLACQVALHEQQRHALAAGHAAVPLDLPASPTADPSWLIVEEGFIPSREHEVESLCAVANGYVGTRGSLAEGSTFSLPATFVAGAFARRSQPDALPALAVAPDWLHLRGSVDDHLLRLEDGDTLEHRRVLDLRQGILWREWRHRDNSGRITRIRGLRLASHADRHVLLQSVLFTPENYSGRVRMESRVGIPHDREDLYPAGFETIPEVSAPPAGQTAPAPGATALEFRVVGTDMTVACAAISQVQTEQRECIPPDVETGKGWFVERWDVDVAAGKTYRLDRLVAIHTSRDTERPVEASVRLAAQRLAEGMERSIGAHTAAWASRWQAAGVDVEGDDEAQRAMRFALYHLISAAIPEDDRVSIGARALTGAAYMGHVFWDTEIYLLPFFIFTDPPTARALLMYRHHTLPAARDKARALGYRGAVYAWESADTGEENTPPYVRVPGGEVIRILTGEQEHHIAADVAYAVWQYWQATGDDEFLLHAGAEILLETARFWASRGRLEADGGYHIRQVIGPDEYHEGVDDNAYTNMMAQWNLERGAETARLLAARWPERWRELAVRLALADDEPAEWQHAAETMYTGFEPQSGLFEQFHGYFALEDIDLTAFEGRSVPLDVLLGREHIQRSKVIKQADVVMLLMLLWDHFAPKVREANFRYYEPRTGHGSSLSPAVHALVAARLGDVTLAEHYFRQAAEIDLANNMGNAAAGVHVAAMGGLWQVAVLGFAGMRLLPNGLIFDPHLPPRWRSLRFSVQWRERAVHVAVAQEPPTVEVQFEGKDPMTLALADGPEVAAISGHRYTARREHDRWGPWQEQP